MQITDVRVRRFEKEGNRMKGIATVTLDNCFIVTDIRIIDGEKGLFIAMPSRKTATGEYKDIAHPLDQETRNMFQDAIMEEYNNTELPAEEA